jgi:hypothetical protein
MLTRWWGVLEDGAYCKGQPIAECSGDAVRMELQRLSRRRSSREMESIMELELESV